MLRQRRYLKSLYLRQTVRFDIGRTAFSLPLSVLVYRFALAATWKVDVPTTAFSWS